MKINQKILFIIISFLSFTTSSCFEWGARAFEDYPEETALDKMYSYDGKVIVIGAGASGLAAAKILERNDINYKIIEATDRYGGRLKKNTELADFPIDIGAEWIHNQGEILNRLKGKPGDELDEELIPYRLEEVSEWDGEKLKATKKKKLDSNFDFFPEFKFKNSTWYDFIDENFAAEVKHEILFNSPVTEIDYSGDKVKVKTEDGTIHEADKVLLTVSIGVLQKNKISFIPDLGKKKKKAIEDVEFLPGFKLVMKFSEKFYPDVVNCKVKKGEKGYYDMAFKKESQSNILGLLVTGESAEEFYALGSEEAIIASALTELDLIFDGKASEAYMEEYVFANWGQHEFTLGTWTNAALDRGFSLKNLKEPLQDKVFFAGEIYEEHKQLGVPGAVLSGYDGIDELLSGE